jgi:hypothetical protein
MGHVGTPASLNRLPSDGVIERGKAEQEENDPQDH